MDLKLLEGYAPSVGALPFRSYYIPFKNAKYDINKEKSDQVKVLDKWKFEYFPFYTAAVDDCKPEREITVPSCWQLLGYDYNQYTNTHYPFPFDPPYIRRENPCGVYETEYTVENKNGKYYIIFDGVDSAYYLFVNGREIGFATGSHVYHEFDITDYVNEGKNLIRAVVFKWCFGSYLEDQDKFRFSGIIRDVYVLNRPNEHITDYKITTDYSGNVGKITVKTDKNAEIKVYDGEELIATQVGEKCEFVIENVKLWSGETPFLYTVTLSYGGEVITDFVGVRKVTIDGRKFLLNGKPIKLKGVNRHTSTPKGNVEDIDDILLDLKILKEHNVNAIRTSHYQPHPYLPLLCDKAGIYLMLEADIENHGFLDTNFEKLKHGDITECIDNPLWKAACTERTVNAFQRDKNRASVIIWSLGNESGWGCNFVATADYLHSEDDRPVHYENYSRYNNRDTVYDVPETDVFSYMYMGINDCAATLKNPATTKPLVLCEYTHAMGNSCGDIKAYWDLIYSTDDFVGGFIWEYCDHYIKDEDGCEKYGGDFGEFPHFGKCCVDGLVDNDRKFIHSSLKETKEVYAPVDVKYENGEYEIINRYDFISLDGLKCKCFVEVNGEKVRDVTVDVSGIPARGSRKIKIDTDGLKGYVTVNFYFYENDFEIAKRQVILSKDYPLELVTSRDAVELFKNEDDGITAVAGNVKFVIGRDGTLSSIKKDGTEYLKEPARLLARRAYIDNELQDIYFRMTTQLMADNQIATILSKAYFYAIERNIEGNKAIIKGRYEINALAWHIDVTLVYAFYDDGSVNIDVKAERHGEEWRNMITKFGFEFSLCDGLENLEYFGRGKYESYEDKKLLAVVGKYKMKTKDNFVYYVHPQEGGSHVETREVALTNNAGKGLSVVSGEDFSFSVQPLKIDEYPTHRVDMLKKHDTVLCVDYRNRAVGSRSCGDELPPSLLINEKVMSYEFTVKVL